MNAQEIIDAAYSEIRYKKAGYALTSEDVVLGLGKLNRMLSGWALEDLLIPHRTTETFTLSVGVSSYTIGVGGVFNTVRPVSIGACILSDGSSVFVLGSPNLDQFEHLATDYIDRLPSAYYYEPLDPLGVLRFDTGPDIAYSLKLHSFKPTTGFAALTTADSFPSEYEEVVISNLAVRLAPDCGKEASASTQRVALGGLANIRARNTRYRVPTLRVDSALLRRTNFDMNQG